MFRVIDEQPVLVTPSNNLGVTGYVADLSRSNDGHTIVARTASGEMVFAGEGAISRRTGFVLTPMVELVNAVVTPLAPDGSIVTGYSHPVWLSGAENPFDPLGASLMLTQHFQTPRGEPFSTIFYVLREGLLRELVTLGTHGSLGYHGANGPFAACQLFGPQSVVFQYTDFDGHGIALAAVEGGDIIWARPLYKAFQDHAQNVTTAGRLIALADGWSVLFINRQVGGVWSVGCVLFDADYEVVQSYPDILVDSAGESLVATGVSVLPDDSIEMFYNIGATGRCGRARLKLPI